MPRYPFTPDILDAMPEELAELFRGLEDKILEEICSRLKLSGQLNEVTVQDIRALRSHGIDIEEIKKAIKDTTGVSKKKLDNLFDNVVKDNQKYYKQLITLADVTEPQTLVDQSDIDAIRRQTWAAFQNITTSMGFLVRTGGRLTLLPYAKAYWWALDSATMQIQSGAFSYNEAIRNAVKQLAQSGLKTVDYESGHTDQIDVAARRAVMTGVNQLNSKYREQSMDYLETDLVEVTAHLGARNIRRKGEPAFVAHTNWQGGVYRRNDKQKSSTGNYSDFETACGYGDVQGILGANCRHSFWPFIEGVMERTYTDEELEDMKPENRPKIEFEGKKYDDYQATQKQRQIERTIRKLKREKSAYEAVGLEEDALTTNIRINRLSKKYTDFSKASGLPEQRERMNISYIDKASEQKAIKRKADREALANGLGRRSNNTGAFSILPERMTKKHIREVAKEVDISLKNVKIFIDADEEKLKPDFVFAGRADPDSIGRIDFFPKAFISKEELVRTIFHEKIHIGQFKEFGSEFVQKNRSWFEKIAYDKEKEFIDKLKKEGKL